MLIRAFSVAVLVAWSVAAQAQSSPPVPMLEGPVPEAGAMHAGLGPLAPGSAPADFGYVTEEYFVSGTANDLAYRTRILVRRPEPAERFSGIVVAEAMHANGFATTFEAARKSIMMRGHVHIEIAAQQINIATLKGANPARYASLGIASADQASEIMAQVGRLVKYNLRGGPLAPLAVRRLILAGSTQASVVLRVYQAQKHFQARMPDGGAIVDGYLAIGTPGAEKMMVVDVPTVHMPTMTEVNGGGRTGGAAFERDDSDAAANRYRLYEVAGMAQANSRDAAAFTPNPCSLPVSDFPWGAMAAMGLNHLVDWVDRAIVPPHAQRLQFDDDTANDGSRLGLDRHGNVTGGVRNTYVDVPVAQYGVPNAGATQAADPACSLAGWRVAYDAETLQQLYRNHAAYAGRVNRRLIELMREGWVLPEYAEDVRADAQRVEIPVPGREK
jgi:hypothetical protein